MRHALFRLGILVLSAIVMSNIWAGSVLARDSRDGFARVDVGGFKLNSLLLPKGGKGDLPPIVFIHGASTSLYDPVYSFRRRLEGRATLLFVDRPGHGQSDSGSDQTLSPDGQADAIARLMEQRGIRKAVIVGHSFGGAVTAAFALRHPDKVLGLVFLSPAVYPWPGGIAWYYDAARPPITGHLFSTLIAPSFGIFSLQKAADSVFAPNKTPSDYISQTKAWQALRPDSFRHNAREVGDLNNWARVSSPNYKRIHAPTVIITGDADGIVSPKIHSFQLARAIRGSRLIVVHNLGHKSDYVAGDLAVAAIETLAGRKRDFTAIKSSVEAKIADDK
ncbi:alpha/beta fold hydrolase [Oryzifoliimicrobium ureilyticus]|uniref:alpha/beta fold hydrolase n=1 Tax=Oryzifoliimicrobium ureilyticus TaxID=3113724 RepID=UPI003F672557